MFVISNFIIAIAKIVDILLNLMLWCIIIRSLLSWVNPDPYNAIVQMLNRITDPILQPIRRLIPMFNMGIDLSPFIACLAIIFLQSFAIRSLYQIAQAMH
ncbi:MAG: YggT family protein [Candidatus Omnitrophica bacterium]|nr:YggT family protein [Candidatus Omnitrophota bacterium]